MRRASTTFRVIGSLGMMIFFGLLAFNESEVGDNPQWLIWPAAVAMWTGLPASILLDLWRRAASRRRD